MLPLFSGLEESDANVEGAMIQHATVTDRILGEVSHVSGCSLDELAFICSDLTWNQVFFEIDHLSRTGRVRLQSVGRSH